MTREAVVTQIKEMGKGRVLVKIEQWEVQQRLGMHGKIELGMPGATCEAVFVKKILTEQWPQM